MSFSSSFKFIETSRRIEDLSLSSKMKWSRSKMNQGEYWFRWGWWSNDRSLKMSLVCSQRSRRSRPLRRWGWLIGNLSISAWAGPISIDLGRAQQSFWRWSQLRWVINLNSHTSSSLLFSTALQLFRRAILFINMGVSLFTSRTSLRMLNCSEIFLSPMSRWNVSIHE